MQRARLKPYDREMDCLLKDITHAGQKFVNGKWYRVSDAQAAKLERVRQGHSGNRPQDVKTPFAFDIIEDTDEAFAKFQEMESLREAERLAEIGGEQIGHDGVIVAKSAQAKKKAKAARRSIKTDAAEPENELDGITGPASEPDEELPVDTVTGRSVLNADDDDLDDIDDDDDDLPIDEDDAIGFLDETKTTDETKTEPVVVQPVQPAAAKSTPAKAKTTKKKKRGSGRSTS